MAGDEEAVLEWMKPSKSGLANGTRYVFEVRAVNERGAGKAASVSTTFAKSPSSAVEVPDAELRKYIERTLGLASGEPITQGDLAKLRRLVGKGRCYDLAGLEFAINLVTLELRGLWGNKGIVDVSPLSGLTSLTRLDLDGNAISDISPLGDLRQLEPLGLSRNAIADILPLLRSGLRGASIYNYVDLARQSAGRRASRPRPGIARIGHGRRVRRQRPSRAAVSVCGGGVLYRRLRPRDQSLGRRRQREHRGV